MAAERDLNGVVLGGRYRVLAQIGGGGMGTVHAGEHLEVGRKVAIKILLPDAVTRPALVERFRREARLTARIEHEHVVECLDFGVSEAGECFYVMEWLRGEDLHALLRRERALAWPRARAIVAQVCRALAAAHDRGVVHRDLKPGNIFLVQREGNPDFVKVLDFGIAKLIAPDEPPAETLTRAGEVVGTTPYMAPELAAGEPFDHRIDVYAVGVILFQLLSGRLPFRGKTPRQLLAEVLRGEPPRLAEMSPGLIVSPALEVVLGRALHRDAGQRFADMAALHEALLALPEDACRSGQAGAAAPDPSASEVALAASISGPMLAGSRDPASESGRRAATTDARGEPEEPRTPIDPPRSVGVRRALAVVAAAGLLGVVGLVGWFVWPRGEAAGADEVALASEVVATTIGELARAAPAPVALPGPVTSERQGPLADDRSGEATAEPVSSPAAESLPIPAKATATATADAKQRPRGEARSGFDDVMRGAATRVRRCLAQGGVKPGTRVRFDIVVEARTGRITAATPRPPFAGQAKLGACVVDATRGSSVRPPPVNEWRRSHEFSG